MFLPLFFELPILYCVTESSKGTIIIVYCPLHRAYAKINLGLLVVEKRPDSYHNIETIFHRIDLSDEIHFEQAPAILVSCSTDEAPSNETNICYKAAQLLQQHAGVRSGVKITIKKNIPVGAGLGGGSADAGLVLRELPGFWGCTVSDAVLQSIGLQLGSDVPYFLGKGTALAKGRGEILEYFQLDVPYSILVCHPNIHVSTAWAYQRVTPAKLSIDLKRLVIEGMKNPLHLVNGLRNDFEPAVFREHPEIMRVKETMMRGGADFALMSGSGSSVFAFFSRADFAREVEEHLQSLGYRTSLTKPHFSRTPGHRTN